MNKLDMIEMLSLNKHVEGGYFSETYRSEVLIETNRKNSSRSILTSIYYMLTDDSPIGYFHKNTSDIIHYFHAGNALTYLIITADGKLDKLILGNDVFKNQKPQLIVKGGCWKASILEEGEYGLLGESVAPGFDYLDMELGTPNKMRLLFPHLWDKISSYVKA